MYAFDPILRRGRNQAPRCEVCRCACELCRTSGRAATAKEEDNRRPPVALLPPGRKVEIHF